MGSLLPFAHCWRWFGPQDPVALGEVRQTGATGIVTALHHLPAGAVWPADVIGARKRSIQAEGFSWSVAESLPVHEEIKRGGSRAGRLTAAYCDSLRNLGACGVRTVCYNFMPVLDWSRTELEAEFSDGSVTTAFQSRALAAFDLFLLKRPHAEQEYTPDAISEAEEYFRHLSTDRREKLVQTVLLGFPGSGETLTLEELRSAIAGYAGISRDEFRQNLVAFLREVVPAAEEAGIRLALHPDDPPWSVLGLPRIAGSGDDLTRILAAVDSPANGITFCTGSLGAGRRNDVPALAEKLAPRINFVHLRNVTHTGEADFLESGQLEGAVDMYAVVKTLLLEQQRRVDEGRWDTQMPMRPDHGRLMSADRKDRAYYPGYSLLGRMRGLAELRGLELGILRSLEHER